MKTRAMASNAPLTWILTGVAILFLLLGLRTFFLPLNAAATFGIPPQSQETLAYISAYGARNIGLSLAGLGMIWLDARRPLALVFAGAAIIALADCWIVSAQMGFAVGAWHLCYVMVTAVLATLAWGRSAAR